MITIDKLMKAGFSGKLHLHYPSIIASCELYLINTPRRFAAFMANAAHETGGFNSFVENLNYSSTGLIATWPSRFTKEKAEALARRPEQIANYVYGGRYGNTEPGDGWRYRGRGIFQITFKDNYSSISKSLEFDFVKYPEQLSEPPFAAKSAAYYWQSKELNKLADIEDLTGITKKINGGLNGHKERVEYYNRLIRLMV